MKKIIRNVLLCVLLVILGMVTAAILFLKPLSEILDIFGIEWDANNDIDFDVKEMR